MKWSVIGHKKQKAYLERLTMSRLPHALLLCGPEGIGKRMMAEDLASALVPQGYQFDRVTLAPERDEDGKRHAIPVEAVRDLKVWISRRPMGAHKVILVDDADWMVGDAANTMLKMLEEPPAYAHFFLITSRAGAILPTMSSRCERLDFLPLTEDEMATALKGLKLDADDRELLGAVVAGRPGAATRLVADKRLPEAAKAVAGLEKALKAGLAERLIFAKTVADSEHASDIVSWWLAWTRTNLESRPKLAPIAGGLLELSDALTEPSLNRRLAVERFFLGVSGQAS